MGRESPFQLASLGFGEGSAFNLGGEAIPDLLQQGQAVISAHFVDPEVFDADSHRITPIIVGKCVFRIT